MRLVKEHFKRKAQIAALGIFLKFILPVLLVLGLFLGIIFAVLALTGDAINNSSGGIDGELIEGMLSPEVLAYMPLVEEYAMEYEIEDYVGILLALMMQESAGRGNDPMQASESLCGSVGCITDPEESIEQGVYYFSQMLNNSDEDVKLALQSYNFGGGFIDFVMDNGGSYSFDLAVDFSAMKYEELQHTGNYSCIRPEALQYGACYGDIFYVDAVLRYYGTDDVIPVDGDYTLPVQGSEMTSDYGYRIHPISGERRFHNGIDYGCINHITPIFSVQSGVVEYAEHHVNNNGTPGYGNLVMVRHHNGLITAYAHLSNIDVNEGDYVEQGQRVGVCGSTGSSTGPHLHFETKTDLWDGHIDPKEIIDGLGGSI